MREIKFRAWDVESQDEQMLYWSVDKQDFDLDVFLDNPDVFVMQYTGLKDKNGKEIYEGDILEFTDKWEWYRGDYGIKMHFADGEKLETLKARYEAEPMHRRTVEFDPHSGYGLSKGDLENFFAIIGNIYEHPELLK